MNSTDSSREFESDFESVCGIAQLTRHYPHVTNYDMILKQKSVSGFHQAFFMVFITPVNDKQPSRRRTRQLNLKIEARFEKRVPHR